MQANLSRNSLISYFRYGVGRESITHAMMEPTARNLIPVRLVILNL